LKPEDLTNNTVMKLRYVKFQNVQNLTVRFHFNKINLKILIFIIKKLFFPNNQSSAETTRINYIKLIGSPLSVTNMNEFKRVNLILS
jgi:hypothetical protein